MKVTVLIKFFLDIALFYKKSIVLYNKEDKLSDNEFSSINMLVKSFSRQNFFISSQIQWELPQTVIVMPNFSGNLSELSLQSDNVYLFPWKPDAFRPGLNIEALIYTEESGKIIIKEIYYIQGENESNCY